MTANSRTRVDRRETARRLLQSELEKLPADEREIVERFIANRRVSRNIVQEYDRSAGLGERIADKVAEVGGSWGFIITFLLCLVAWMAFNTFVLAKGAFDPYPYILLNLCLSCVAASQAPTWAMTTRLPRTVMTLPARVTDCTVGSRLSCCSAVAAAFGMKFRGYIAWLMWLFIHLLFLVGLRNRIAVVVQWIYAYFTWRRGARIITRPPFHEEETPE